MNKWRGHLVPMILAIVMGSAAMVLVMALMALISPTFFKTWGRNVGWLVAMAIYGGVLYRLWKAGIYR